MSGAKQDKTAQQLSQVMTLYKSSKFLTQHSLFANLYSSQPFKLQIGGDDSMKVLLSKGTLNPNQLHQFIYYNSRDKKAILYQLLSLFLSQSNKSQMVVIQNSSRGGNLELQEYLKGKGAEEQNRILYRNCESAEAFRYWMLHLPLLMKRHEFLSCVVLLDINSYEKGDKSTLEKIYQKVPKNLAVLSFRRDYFDHKIFQRSLLDSSHFTISEKIAHSLQRTYSHFTTFLNLVVPVEAVEYSITSIQDAFNLALIRAHNDKNSFIQAIFSAFPFKLHSVRQI